MASRLMDALVSTRTGPPALWLDSLAYERRTLRDGGDLPWLEPAELAAHCAKAHALLGGSVATLAVAPVCAAWLAANPEWVAAMGGRRRVGFALKTLLGGDKLRDILGEIVGVLSESQRLIPFVLVLPSPHRWLTEAHAVATATTLDTIEVDEEDVESASVVVADFLRIFAEARIDGVLLEESRGGGVFGAAETARYRPVVNVAHHYRWTVGLHRSEDAATGEAAEGIDLAIGGEVGVGGVAGVVIPKAFWAGEPPPALPRGGFYFAEIPGDAVPERVLDRLVDLRSASSLS